MIFAQIQRAGVITGLNAAIFFLAAATAMGANYRAGTGRVDITPQGPFPMAGYGSRTKPSDGVLTHLWAKALAIEDSRGSRVVILTTDLLGLPRTVTDVVGARMEKEYGLQRSHLLVNCSHTHTGPRIRGNLDLFTSDTPEQQAQVTEYTQRLTNQLVEVIASALGSMQPASLNYGTGVAGFAVNRREPTASGVKIGVNPAGPVDHAVPVLKVSRADGAVLAIVFGYACHNTTLTAEHYKISGDYAGFAEAELEEAHPGATALFLQLCAGNQNPNPRREESIARQHGHSLAGEVERVLAAKPANVKGRLEATLQWKDLPLQPHSAQDFEKMLSDKEQARVVFARAMLRRYQQGSPVHSVPYPVQAVRVGDGLVIVALGGEVVVEYALRLKASHPGLRLIVAGYSNDVMGYIPTAKMLDEGGYEPVESTIYYGQAAPFAPELEKIILDAADQAIRRVKP